MRRAKMEGRGELEPWGQGAKTTTACYAEAYHGVQHGRHGQHGHHRESRDLLFYRVPYCRKESSLWLEIMLLI